MNVIFMEKGILVVKSIIMDLTILICQGMIAVLYLHIMFETVLREIIDGIIF